MNIQQFLEEEFKDYGVRMSEDEDHFEFESPSPSKILDFANKVLDEVKNSLEKELEKWDESAEELEDGWGNYTVCLPWELKEKKVDISTIISQLKLK